MSFAVHVAKPIKTILTDTCDVPPSLIRIALTLQGPDFKTRVGYTGSVNGMLICLSSGASVCDSRILLILRSCYNGSCVAANHRELSNE